VDGEHEDEARVAYDLVAEDYAALLEGELEKLPLERAMLTAFAEQIAADGGGAVADIGCGPGRVSGFLAGVGLDVCGVDLSPGMIGVARRDHPGIPFEVASMAALPYRDGELAGALAWYSIIHIPQEEQDAVFAEFERVLRPGGRLLLGFQVSEQGTRTWCTCGRRTARARSAHRRQSPSRVKQRLAAAGFAVRAELFRVPVAPEKSRQAFLLAQRTAGSDSEAAAAS
jgi:Methylase involved in ubiquinone/menaquinone biosynthesis